VMYECSNPDCFYCGSLFTFEDVDWRDVWSSEFEDLVPVAKCASCGGAMMFWEEE